MSSDISLIFHHPIWVGAGAGLRRRRGGVSVSKSSGVDTLEHSINDSVSE